jgi:hypothetical protein
VLKYSIKQAGRVGTKWTHSNSDVERLSLYDFAELLEARSCLCF